MFKLVLPLAVVLSISACSGSAIVKPTDSSGGATAGDALVDLPGDTAGDGSITHYEAADGAGSGYAKSISYDSATDTFSVDNLAFDGDNTYTRSAAMPNIGGNPPAAGPFQVYEGPASTPDSVTGTPIPQFLHRAIYGKSTSGNTQFAIVRTGSYRDYGFGGFVYQRNGSVTLPTTGQANYKGQYAGLVDYNGDTGINYSSGDMAMQIDFKDFNAGDGVAATVSNRQYYDMSGANVTGAYLTALNSDLNGATYTELPSLVFNVGPGTNNAQGEIAGTLGSTVVDGTSGAVTTHESGQYYGVLAGDSTTGNDEVVGVIVVTSKKPGTGNTVTQRETGGFLLYRN